MIEELKSAAALSRSATAGELKTAAAISRSATPGALEFARKRHSANSRAASEAQASNASQPGVTRATSDATTPKGVSPNGASERKYAHKSVDHLLEKACVGPEASEVGHEASEAACSDTEEPSTCPGMQRFSTPGDIVTDSDTQARLIKEDHSDAPDSLVQRIGCGGGNNVNGLCFEFADGSRRGVVLGDVLADGGRATVNLADDRALMRVGVEWQSLEQGEFIAKVSGHRSWRRYLAADVVLWTAKGRQITFGGRKLGGRCGAPFEFQAVPGHEITEVLFDLELSECSGIRERPILRA